MDTTPEKEGFLTGIKNNAKIYGLILAVAVFFFSFGHNARASEILSINQNLATNYLNDGVQGQSFVASSSSISSLEFYTNGWASIATGSITICKGIVTDFTATTTALGCGFAGNELAIFANIKPTNPVSTWLNYKLPVIVKTDIGYPYYFMVEDNMAGAYVYQKVTNPYTSGQEIYKFSATPNDLTFRIYSDFLNSQLVYYSPINGFTYNTGYIYYTGYVNGEIIDLNIWTDNLTNGDTYHTLNYHATSTGITYEWSIPQHLQPATYRARYIAGSATQTFTASSTFYIATDATTTDAENISFVCPLVNMSCAIVGNDFFSVMTNLNNFGCFFEKIGLKLLCPSAEHVAEISQTKDILRESFPFSAFIKLTDDINTALATASSTISMNDTLGVPMIRKTATSTEFYIVPVISSTSMAKLTGQANATMIRTTLGYFIWIITGALMLIWVRTIG